MRITGQIAAVFPRLWSLLSKKENVMSDHTIINSTTTPAKDNAVQESALSPLESFANEIAAPAVGSSTASQPASGPAAADGVTAPAVAAVTDAPDPSAADAAAQPASAAPDVSDPAAADAAAQPVSAAPDASDPAAADMAAQPVSDVPEAVQPAADVTAPVSSTVDDGSVPDLTRQLATPDDLANGSASAGPSSASTPGMRAQPLESAAASSAGGADELSASVRDFVQAFHFVEQGIEKLGAAARDELMLLARKYL